MINICHISSVHPRYDIRIFEKECRSLADEGYRVTLYVADSEADEYRAGVNIKSIGPLRNRFIRMLIGPFKFYSKIRREKFECLHIHDPELLPLGLVFRALNQKVIFDSHEITADQILSKKYLPQILRPVISYFFALFLRRVLPKLTGVISATGNIDKHLNFELSNRQVIHNFPILPIIDKKEKFENRDCICYIGVVTRDRCAEVIVKAMQYVKSDISLVIMGRLEDSRLGEEIRELDKKGRVRLIGHSARGEVEKLLSKSMAGLCFMQPTPAYVESLPTKIFEYMAHGVPVICSNFPQWVSLIDNGKAGMYCDSLDVHAIAQRIDCLVFDPNKAQNLGISGREKVKENYSWNTEKIKLLEFYNKVLSDL